jgi:DNA gyrase inhibitor GyrI
MSILLAALLTIPAAYSPPQGTEGRDFPARLKSGREPADFPGFQHHHNAPPETPPEDLVTDIYVQLKPR